MSLFGGLGYLDIDQPDWDPVGWDVTDWWAWGIPEPPPPPTPPWTQGRVWIDPRQEDRGPSLGRIIGMDIPARDVWETIYGRPTPGRVYQPPYPAEVWHLPELWGPGPNFTVPQEHLGAVDLLLAAFRVLAGLVRTGTMIGSEDAAERIIAQSQLPAVLIQQTQAQVDQERVALETRQRAGQLLEEPPAEQGPGGGRAVEPGRQPVGYNPNDPYLPGGAEDPAGRIDPRRNFPTTKTLRDLLEALGIQIPDPRDPAVVRQVVLYWLGRVFGHYQRLRQEQLLGDGQLRDAINWQLLLQQWLMFYRSLPVTTQYFNAATLERVKQLGVGAELPTPPSVTPLPVVVCGFENDDDQEGDCICPSDKH